MVRSPIKLTPSFATWLLMLLLVGLSTSAILSSPDPDQLVSQADVVCKGRVLRVWSNGADHSENALIKIDRLFKGQYGLSDGRELNVQFDDLSTPRAGDYRLFFIVRSSSGNFFVPNRWEIMRASENDATIPDGLTEPSEILKLDLLASLHDPDKEIVLSALLLLGRFKKLESVEDVKRLIPNKDKEIEGNALLALMHRNDLSVFEQAVEYAEPPLSEERLKLLQAKIGISFGNVREIEKLPMIHELTRSLNMWVRYGAIQAIGQIASVGSIPYLIERLDDDQENIRFAAVMGLARIVGQYEDLNYNDYGPGIDLFRSNESRYIDNWKKWWKRNNKM